MHSLGRLVLFQVVQQTGIMFASVLLLVVFRGVFVCSEDPNNSWLMTKVKSEEGGIEFRNQTQSGSDFELTDLNASTNVTSEESLTKTSPETEDKCGVEVLTYHFRSEIVFRYATTSLRSKMRNCGDEAKQLNFSVTIQDSAFISNFTIEMDGVVYTSSVKEKDQADTDFNEAVTSGLGAAQVAVSAREANTYTIQVNIEPRSEVTFNLTYEELLVRRLNVYDHVITFNPGQMVKDMKAEVDIFEAQNITTLTVYGGNAVQSNTSSVVIAESAALVNRSTSKTAHVFYRPRKIPASLNVAAEQLHVQYDVDRSSEAGDVVLMDGFFVHFFSPKSLVPLPKHVVFALDTSGSMWGRKLQQTQEAMTHVLRELREGDYFSIISFGTKVEEWSPLPQHLVGIRSSPTTLEVNQRNVESAIDYIQSLQASGGTDIITALRKSLQIAARREYNLANITDQEEYNRILPKPMIVFLTDGVPTDGELIPTMILAKVRAANAQTKAAIFTLAFGDGASQAFLRRLALQNNGFSRRIYEAADVSLQLQSFYEEISSPLLSNVTFVYKHHKVNTKALTCHMFHTYYGGSELVVVGKIDDLPTKEVGGIPSDLEVAEEEGKDNEISDFVVEISSLKTNDNQEKYKKQPSVKKPIMGYNVKRTMGVLERMWAYLSIRQHLDQDLISDEQVTTHDAGALRVDHKKEALKIALKYQFVTPLTSLVVVKTTNQSEVTIVQLNTPIEDTDRDMSPVVENNMGVNSFLGSHIVPKPLLSFAFGSPMVAAVKDPPTPADPVQHSSTQGSSPVETSSVTTPSSQHLDPASSTSLPLHKDSMTFRNFTLAELVWLPDHLDASGHLVVPNETGSEPGIFTIYDQEVSQDGAPQPSCSTPAGVSGTCRPVAQCVQPAFTEDFDAFLTYFCALGSLAGVCCPSRMSFLRI